MSVQPMMKMEEPSHMKGTYRPLEVIEKPVRIIAAEQRMPYGRPRTPEMAALVSGTAWK